MITRAIILSLIVLAIGCNKPNKATKDVQDGLNKSGPLTDKIYPHTPSFRKSAEHGDWYKESRDTCTICHGQDLKGGNAKTSCWKCHTTYPHTDEFKSCEDSDSCSHGSAYREKTDDCLKCHDTKAGKKTLPNKKACYDCHNNYPHTMEFRYCQEDTVCAHAQSFLNDEESCTKCHKIEKTPGASMPSCHDCHNYPHTKEFKECPEKRADCAHGVAFTKDRELGKAGLKSHDQLPQIRGCVECHAKEHKLLKKGKLVDVKACSTCHKVEFPHSGSFKDPAHHGSHKKLVLEHLEQCKTCHLGFSKGRAPKMEDFTKLFPKSFTRYKKQECIDCHKKEGVIAWKSDLELRRGLLTNKYCLTCHSEEAGSNKYIAKWGVDDKGKDVQSCAACHFPNRQPDINIRSKKYRDLLKQKSH